MHHLKWAGLFTVVLLLFNQPAYTATFSLMPGDDIVGEIKTIVAKKGDSFASLAKHYGLSLHEIKEANPNIKTIRANQEIVLPTQFILPPSKYREGIVINMPELRLYFFRPDGRTVDTYPVAMGRPGWRTPITKTSIIRKEVEPTWNVPKSIWQHTYQTKGISLPDSVPPGPKNPLGPYALYMAHTGYLIHGNNQPESIGKYASSGCIRMYNKDITELFPRVPIGTVVYITNHQYKAGWKENKLFFKAQQAIELNKPNNELNLTTPAEVITEATLNRSAHINQDILNLIVDEETGVPQQIN